MSASAMEGPAVADRAALSRKQRGVKVGIALGLVASAAVIGGGYVLTPELALPTAGDRLAFALRFAPLSVLMVLAGIGAVANARFASDAIDPLAGAERGRMLVH